MVNFSVFNELSLPLKNLNEFEDFFKILDKLKKNGINKIRMEKQFSSFNEILPNITFQQLVGQTIDRDKRRRLLNFQNNTITVIENPLIRDNETEQNNQILENEYFYKEKSTKGGLASCDIWNTIAISFNSKEDWNKYNITLQKQNISEENEIDICVRHASKTEHLKYHKTFFDDLENESKLNITQDNFWDRKEEFFPKKIVFCKEVEKQIKNMDKTIFKQAIGILRDIENNKKLITDYSHSREGSTVHTTPKLKKLRKFNFKFLTLCFDNHIKSLPNANRIYFLEHKKKIYIGYLGKHLPTKKHK